MSSFPYKRIRGPVVPWGYDRDKNDSFLAVPDDEALNAYEKAKELIKEGCSYRDVANWLSASTDRQITAPGLFLKIRDEQRKERSRKAKEAYEKRTMRPLPDHDTEERTVTEAEEE